MKKFLLVVVILLFTITFGYGIITIGSTDPSYNSSPPQIEYLVDSGWQYVGKWGSFCGVPISPRHFVTAKHVGGTVGQSLLFDGDQYPTISKFSSPTADITIWETSVEFLYWAPIFDTGDEIGKTAVLIGRGTRKGIPLIATCTNIIGNYTTNCVTNMVWKPLLKNKNKSGHWVKTIDCNIITNSEEVVISQYPAGWAWGGSDGVQRWGTNIVEGASGLLSFYFDGDAGDDECTVSSGDSSGAIFILDSNDLTWKLAGVISYVSGQGPFAMVPEGPYYSSAVFDAGGLWSSGNQLPCDVDYQGSAYGTRLFPLIPWISEILNLE